MNKPVLPDYLSQLDLSIPTVLELKSKPEQALALLDAIERRRTSFNLLIKAVSDEVGLDTNIVRTLAIELYKKV